MQCYIIIVNSNSLRPHHATLGSAAGLYVFSKILAPPLSVM